MPRPRAVGQLRGLHRAAHARGHAGGAGQDYIRTARAKGLAERDVVVKHAAAAGILPWCRTLAGRRPGIHHGSIVIEQIFAVPGSAATWWWARSTATNTLVMGAVLFYASFS